MENQPAQGGRVLPVYFNATGVAFAVAIAAQNEAVVFCILAAFFARNDPVYVQKIVIYIWVFADIALLLVLLLRLFVDEEPSSWHTNIVSPGLTRNNLLFANAAEEECLE